MAFRQGWVKYMDLTTSTLLPRLIRPSPLLSNLAANNSALSPGYGFMSQSNLATMWWQVDYTGSPPLWKVSDLASLLWMLTFGMDLHFLSTKFQPTLQSVILLNAYPVNLHSIPYSFWSRDSVTFKKVRQLTDNYGFTGLTMFPIVVHCTWETKSYDISFSVP